MYRVCGTPRARNDELFGGYSFTRGSTDDADQWKDKRDMMCAKWTFATEAIARSYGLHISSPYVDPASVDCSNLEIWKISASV